MVVYLVLTELVFAAHVTVHLERLRIKVIEVMIPGVESAQVLEESCNGTDND